MRSWLNMCVRYAAHGGVRDSRLPFAANSSPVSPPLANLMTITILGASSDRAVSYMLQCRVRVGLVAAVDQLQCSVPGTMAALEFMWYFTHAGLAATNLAQ